MKNFYNRLKFNQNTNYSALQQCLGGVLPCALCGGPQPQRSLLTGLCSPCAKALPWYDSPSCPQCALPTESGRLCGACLQHAPAFDRTLAVFRYAYPLDRMLHQFKYHQQLAWGHLFADAMWPRLTGGTANAQPDVLMHVNRLRQRGYNHALELAKEISRHWPCQLETEGCQRLIDTPTQAGMDMQTRTRNLRGAFATEQLWTGRHVLLVDDVMTTGASMHAVAKRLKQAGASRVTALVLARTLKDD